jgi:hypothetical protein
MSSVEPDERFERMFLSRVSARIGGTFSDEQLMAIKTVFGAEHWDGHAVDLRFTTLLPFRRWYFVILGGPERRIQIRPENKARSRARAIALKWTMAMTVGTLATVWLGLMVFYFVAV